jgi:hypothetical protein
VSCAGCCWRSCLPVAVASKVRLLGRFSWPRVEEEARDLCVELVRDTRDEHQLTWSHIGEAFGITMQSAQWRFSHPSRKAATRLRR